MLGFRVWRKEREVFAEAVRLPPEFTTPRDRRQDGVQTANLETFLRTPTWFLDSNISIDENS